MTTLTPWLVQELVRRREELLPRFAAYYRQLSALPRRTRRRLQRTLRQSLAGLAFLLALGQSQSLAATINVTASCTLVDAITAANTNTVTGGCAAGSGADTIVLPVGSTQTLTAVNNSTYGATGLPVVSSKITIEGNGSTIARDSGAPPFRILALNEKGNLTLKATTISGGQGGIGGGILNGFGTLTLDGCVVKENTALAGGGVLSLTDGSDTLTLSHTLISENTSSYAEGGGVSVLAFDRSQVLVSDSTISGNTAQEGDDGFGFGGGVSALAFDQSRVTLTNTTISGNSAVDCGGGMYSFSYESGEVIVSNSTISGNTARCGGGVFGYPYKSGQVIVSDTTISGNTAYGDGGGLFIENFCDSSSQVIVSNSTISGNTAYSSGGVYSIIGGKSRMMLSDVTISKNSADNGPGGISISTSESSQVTLSNSTISGNTGSRYGAGGGVYILAFYSSQVTLSNSTISGNTAAYRGGGVYSFLLDSGQVTFSRMLIAGNVSGDGAEVFHDTRTNLGGSFIVNAFNLLGHSGLTSAQAFVGFTPGATDITATSDGTTPTALNAILDPTLQNNGGPTQTHNLVSGSPAIDAASTSCGLITDQRGFFRPIDGNGDTVATCDIGAVEFASSSDPCATVLPTTGCRVNGRPNQPCVGTPGEETIVGTSGHDVIFGLGGHDVLRGQAGNDLLCGGEGEDALIGGQGSDWLDGEADRDDLTGGPGLDICLNGEKITSCE